MPLSLPPPGGVASGVVRPLRGHRSLGTTTTAATFIVVVVILLWSYWLSCWLSCCCCPLSRVVVVATAAAATAKPPTRSGRRHRRGHLYRRCRRNRIRCSYHHHPHLAAAFTAVVDATVIAPAAASPTQIPSTQLLLLSLAVAITAATAVVAAVAVAFAAAIVAAIALTSAVTIAAASTDVSTTLVRRRLTLGLSATTTRQGATLRSSRHGGEVWR